MSGRTEWSAKTTGRVVGALFLLQVLIAPPVYTEFGILGGMFAPDFLARGAADAVRIRLALLLLPVLSALTLGVAIVVLPIFRRHSEAMALWFLALAVVGLVSQLIESHVLRTMLSLSVEYARPGAPIEVLETLGLAARAAWRSAHFTNLVLGHLQILLFAAIALRFALVPRLLAGALLAATVLSTSAAIIALLGWSFAYGMVAPAALTQLALTLWLLARGFTAPSVRIDSVQRTTPSRAL